MWWNTNQLPTEWSSLIKKKKMNGENGVEDCIGGIKNKNSLQLREIGPLWKRSTDRTIWIFHIFKGVIQEAKEGR